MADDIFDEPHMRAGPLSPAAPEPPLGRSISSDPLEELAHHSVWDEPGAATALTGPPPSDAVSYGTWLERTTREARPWQAWLLGGAAVACSAPLALFGALSMPPIRPPLITMFSVVFVAPLVVECLKVGALAMALERRPNLLGPTSLMVASVTSGAVFGLVQGAVYGALFSAPGAWSVLALAVHMLCGGLTGAGLVAVWRRAHEERTRPKLQHAASWLAASVAVHVLLRLASMFLV